MEFTLIFEKILIFIIFIAALIAIAAYTKKFKFGSVALSLGKNKHLKLEEMLILDSNNKIAVISYHHTSYLIHIGERSRILDRVVNKVSTPEDI